MLLVLIPTLFLLIPMTAATFLNPLDCCHVMLPCIQLWQGPCFRADYASEASMLSRPERWAILKRRDLRGSYVPAAATEVTKMPQPGMRDA